MLFLDVLGRSELVPELLTKSQLVILNLKLRRLQETTNLGATLALGSLGIALLLFLLVQEELSIVTRELAQ